MRGFWVCLLWTACLSLVPRSPPPPASRLLFRRRVRASREDDDGEARGVCIQFIRGVSESVAPTVSVTRSASTRIKGSEGFFTGTATFWFKSASTLSADLDGERLITGMFLEDEEGVISTTDVQARFEQGRPIGISSVLVLSNPTEWNRFMRFMTRYSRQNGLAFTSAADDSTSKQDTAPLFEEQERT